MPGYGGVQPVLEQFPRLNAYPWRVTLRVARFPSDHDHGLYQSPLIHDLVEVMLYDVCWVIIRCVVTCRGFAPV